MSDRLIIGNNGSNIGLYASPAGEDASVAGSKFTFNSDYAYCDVLFSGVFAARENVPDPTSPFTWADQILFGTNLGYIPTCFCIAESTDGGSSRHIQWPIVNPDTDWGVRNGFAYEPATDRIYLAFREWLVAQNYTVYVHYHVLNIPFTYDPDH